jgi:two-component system sensor histidine kinase KdpD
VKQEAGARARSIALTLATSVGTVAAASAVGWFLLGRKPIDVVMTFLLGVVVVAVWRGYMASVLTTALSVAAFDYFFTEPYFSFVVTDRRYLLTFAIMLFVALVIGNQTEHLRRSLETTRARDAEIRNERLRNALLSSVSHDLRTPLAVVKGAATALTDPGIELTAERRREYAQAIADEASRIDRVVRNLLDMTKLEAGVLRARKDWHSLEEVIGSALARLEEQLEGRRVKVTIAPDAALAPLDTILIEQVLVNLVENATKYTPAGSPIDVDVRTVTEGTEGVEVAVADVGPGVPPGEEERIFQKFERGADRAPGMGLGLTICRGILAAHDGTLSCAARPGGGAVFRFVLPRPEPPQAPGRLPEIPPEA